LKIVQAANYPFRSGDIARQPSTDAGSDARLQVGGIKDDSAIIFDFVNFPKTETIPFHIRAMPLAGGVIELYAGEFKSGGTSGDIFHFNVFPIGRLEISGEPGVWVDYTCDLDFFNTNFINYLANSNYPRWDFALVFTGENEGVDADEFTGEYAGLETGNYSGEGGGAGVNTSMSGGELFILSEFYLGHEKPGPAATLDPRVKTGTARGLTMESVVIEDSSFTEIEPQDILEAGVMYHGHWLDFTEADRQAADPHSPFTVTLSLRPGEEFHYRAYVETPSGTYVGGVKRVFTPPDLSGLQELYNECKLLIEADYTAESWIPFAGALRAARELLERDPPPRFQWEIIIAEEDLAIARYWLVDPGQAYTLTVIGGSGSGVYSPWHHLTVIADDPEPGKRFDRWEAEGIDLTGEEKTQSLITLFLPYRNVTLTAIWASLPGIKFTVTFITSGGSSVPAVLIEPGACAVEPPAPVKSGFAFDGWRTGGGSGPCYDFNTPVTADLTLFAAWKEIVADAAIDISSVETSNKQVDVCFSINSPNGKGYTVYLSAAGANGPFSKYGDVSYNNKGVKIKSLTNGKTYFMYIEYNDGKGGIFKSKIIDFIPGK
jgi:uncharacterized repeat protein (TIGR02543 family)